MTSIKALSERYILANWPAPTNIHAFITTRKHGVSKAGYASLNLSVRSGDQPEQVAINRQRVSNDWGWTSSPCWLHQVHGTTVVDAATTRSESEADASVSRSVNVPAIVMVADCVPVLFCNYSGTCVAAAHAGWKGLAAGVLESTIASMQCPPAELLAWIGPAISQPFFEVGPEVRHAFIKVYAEAEQGFISGKGDRWMADLHFLAQQRLQRAGVKNIYSANQCVYKQKDVFFSYRRDGKKSGRMAAAVCITDA
ncbi:MAG: peptidoglycan editing factor PgeF [Endozoicomonas sp. (ex Botrylloides leachii)]|nr:peptidoglycan editing factor PgeF [Endozoicomonas sp. (ex Botrylloides leachii)]